VTGILRAPRSIALAVIAALVAAASLVSFCESFRGLYLWAGEHGLSGLWAAAWPLQIDTFIGVGELALFVALVDRWPARHRAAAWTVTAIGLAVSVAGNVGHVAGHDLSSRVTAAVPPLAAASALAVGLGVLKRVVAMHAPASPDAAVAAVPSPQAPPRPPAPAALANGHAAPESAPEAARLFAAELARGELPSVRRVRREMHLGQPRAQEVRAYLAALTRT
jgi:Protein of unknown function (DUF2637)